MGGIIAGLQRGQLSVSQSQPRKVRREKCAARKSDAAREYERREGCDGRANVARVLARAVKFLSG